VKARTHDIAAATALLGVIVALPELPTVTLSTAFLALIANQAGGIIPDIDQPTAPFWRNLPIGGVVGKVIAKMLGGHRFLTHSLAGLVLVGFLFKMLLIFLQPLMSNVQIDYVWWALIIGMLSHLVMDTFTKEGVPWLLPIPVKFGFPPVRRLRITTGKWTENFVTLPVLVVIALGICLFRYSDLLTFLHYHIVR
jgi:inner membrane protein